jgi:hypothetical protein
MKTDRELIEDYVSRVRADPESSGSLYADECVLHYGGAHALSGDYHGRDEILAMFRHSAATFKHPLSLRPVDIAASERHVIALIRATVGEGESDAKSWLRAIVFRVVDGRIVEQWLLDYDQALVASMQR